jgi:uncharacterized protein (TIGR03118 family)
MSWPDVVEEVTRSALTHLNEGTLLMNARILSVVSLSLLAAACSVDGASQDGSESSTDDLSASKRIALSVSETDLVSDRAGAATLDANLKNPWGIAWNPAGPAWIANNHSGTSTVYDAAGALKLTVTLPAAAGATDPSSPTGQVFNSSATNFGGDKFIFDGEDGRIYGWQPNGGVHVRGDHSASGASYKGLAIATNAAGAARLYLTDFHNGKVDVLDSKYAPVTVAGGFKDPGIPAGYAPFNAQALEGKIFVTFAKQDKDAADDDHGPGRGYVDVFDTEGHLERRLVSRGVLNSPWGLAIAPASFGALAGNLLVGNFGDGKINVFDIHAPAGYGEEKVVAKGALGTAANKPLQIDGLWAVAVGPDQKVYFTAGQNGEDNGLFGRILPSSQH